MSYSNLTVVLISSIRAIVWEHLVGQMRLNVVITKVPETIVNIVDTLNVVARKKIDIFHFDEELKSSVNLNISQFK